MSEHDWQKEPMPYRAIDIGNAVLLCCHCGGDVIGLAGHGALELTRSLTGRVICEDCDERQSHGYAIGEPMTAESVYRLLTVRAGG